jgi:hypothetical protein
VKSGRRNFFFSFFILLLGAFAKTTIAGQTPVIPDHFVISDSAVRQMKALAREKASRTPTQRKIDSRLLLELGQRRDPMLRDALPALRSTLEIDAAEDSLLVDITATVTPDLLETIDLLGGNIVNSHSHFDAIRARLPLESLEDLATLPAVRSIRPADQWATRRMNGNAINVSQGDVAHAANIARQQTGINGSGVRTCVLSDSVDALASLQASGDLPAVTVAPGQSGNPGTSEGTAMLEIVHDLAPGAQLFFATANGGQANFANNILVLRNTYGCNVIVDDIFYFAEPVFQDGIIAQAINQVAASGALYFAAAGNAGSQNKGTSGVWEGNYSPLPSIISGYDSVHSFNGQNHNVLTRVGFAYKLTWSDPLGGSNNDYDLFLLNPSGTQIVAASINIQDGNDDPLEFISASPSDLSHRLVVARWSGNARYLHLNTLRGRLSVSTSGQISDHSGAEGAFAVAAVNVATAGGGVFTGGAANPVQAFSSDGPRRMFFRADGTPYTPGNLLASGGVVRQKPDLAAANGVATATPGFNPFFGTSAAAPHAAAMASLLLQADPGIISPGMGGGLSGSTTQAFRQLLPHVTLDIEAPGFDRDSGHGILMADLLLDSINTCQTPFNDIPCDYWALSAIQKILAAGITAGCGNNNYCPLDPVTRAQMAVFLLRGINGSTYFPPPANGTVFNDVPLGAFAAAWIEQLAASGITSGCGGGNYCPNASITRAQMAIFLLRAKHGSTYSPPPATGSRFADVPLGAFAADWIEQLAAEGITGGCGGGNYCPGAPVNRDQMAVFLVRTFNL